MLNYQILEYRKFTGITFYSIFFRLKIVEKLKNFPVSKLYSVFIKSELIFFLS